jgi:GTP cyclohydrolase I
MANKVDLYALGLGDSLNNYLNETGKEQKSPPAEPWQGAMERAVQLFLDQTVNGTIAEEHVADTPHRFVKALENAVKGCSEDASVYLARTFPNASYDEMVTVRSIRLVTLCAHHLLPIFGKVDFAYIPCQQIVGLSKIPRFIRALSKRPQVQEKLASDIVDLFFEYVKPKGCGVIIQAYHGCMMFRGVEEPTSFTTTTALRGCFKDASVKAEFLNALDTGQTVFP